VARLALRSGAKVVPIALTGTDRVRRGARVRPCKVRLRFGRPLGYPIVESPSPKLALSVTERIWACVSLQWRWLGGDSAEAAPAAHEPEWASGREGADVPARRESAGARGSREDAARAA
jgi:hypothetical protein